MAAESSAVRTLVLETYEEGINKCRRAYTGFLKNTYEASEIKGIFMEEGLFSIRVTMMGPNMCLLEDLVIGEAEAFLAECKEWLRGHFSCIKLWEPEGVALEILVWIRIAKVPCHAWGDKLFKQIAGVYGGFIMSDEQTFNRVSMTEARILIIYKFLSLINEEIQIIVDGTRFS